MLRGRRDPGHPMGVRPVPRGPSPGLAPMAPGEAERPHTTITTNEGVDVTDEERQEQEPTNQDGAEQEEQPSKGEGGSSAVSAAVKGAAAGAAAGAAVGAAATAGRELLRSRSQDTPSGDDAPEEDEEEPTR
jgi:hypothetical protein